MFEILDLINDQHHFDPVIMLLVFAAGYFQKKYTQELFPKVSSALKTLCISFIFCICYVMIKACAGSLQKNMLETYFITYTIATSCYELLLKKEKAASQPDSSSREEESKVS